ncbi:polysaccharide deacetylase family protein [Halalkalibacter okhensis]|uniref:Polysaccharide deacetylase n=1 Tax=Halalkalibacter okhensis TaxID=333138 RepID=A0A0B0INW5_9BACI|nr:polysaccharide deacetylase family protein [Halalkalibacter okhensis]KHF41341.1 polysaccharide deacetylase [Halalkalibacter okhensis]
MKWFQIFLLFAVICLQACATQDENEESIENIGEEPVIEEEVVEEEFADSEKEIDISVYQGRDPIQWGENVEGVKTRIDTDENVIALTFDACGGPYGNGYDEALIDFLREKEIPATLFINERWILEHEALFLELAQDPLFQIENHGTAHVPLSVTGNSAWGIQGTNSPEEVEKEVIGNQETIRERTGQAPTLFRSGTAFYDDVAVEIVNDLGLQVVNFDILGDAGATFTAGEVHQAMMKATSGSIVLLHMNQPNSGTAEGVRLAVLDLQEQGYEFVTLADATLK